jgi:integrase
VGVRAELQKGADGKRRRRIVYGKTRAEAERKLADLKAQHGGKLAPVDPTRVVDYVTTWISTTAKRVRPKTAESYRWAWAHAKPLIGAVRLDRVDRATVLELFAELSRRDASAITVRHVSRVLHTMLADAIADGAYTGVNPFTLVQKQKPKHKVERGRALSVDESVRFIAAARTDRLEAAWVLGLTADLRIGEMFGPKWSDVDLERGSIFVQRQALFLGRHLVIDDLKTVDSLRLPPIGELALGALRRRRPPRMMNRLRFGSSAAQIRACRPIQTMRVGKTSPTSSRPPLFEES